MIGKVLWTSEFLLKQGNIGDNFIYKDNQSTMQFEKIVGIQWEKDHVI